MTEVIKGYNFAIILYPDSVSNGWVDRIRSTHVKTFVSPLHSADPDIEEENKPHYHILMMYDSQTSLRMALDTFNYILNEGSERKYCERVRSLPGYARYLLHLDDPDKQQFDSTISVKCYNGANYEKAIDTDEAFVENLEAMTDYVSNNPGMTFHKLTLYARYNNREWFRIICCRSTIYIRTLITSIREEEKEKAIEEEKRLSR